MTASRRQTTLVSAPFSVVTGRVCRCVHARVTVIVAAAGGAAAAAAEAAAAAALRRSHKLENSGLAVAAHRWSAAARAVATFEREPVDHRAGGFMQPEGGR